MSGAEAWANILRDGERILWQGAPADADRPERRPLLLGIVGGGLGLFVFLGGAWIGVPLSPLGFGVVIWWLAFAALVYSPLAALHRAETYRFYTLTNQRAIVGVSAQSTDRIVSYALDSDAPVTVNFGETTSIYFDRVVDKASGQYEERAVGFENIEDADKVLALLAEIVPPERQKIVAPAQISAQTRT